MTIEEKEKIFNQLYHSVNGYEISRQAVKNLSYTYQAHVYGEILFKNFNEILKQTKPKPDEVFYDLGSGTGKAILAAALCFDFKRCIGIEVFSDLCQAANKVLTNLKQISLLDCRIPEISFINDDFNNQDFSDADIIYSNSVFFQYEFNRLFMNKLLTLKNGSRIITTGFPLNHPELVLFDQKIFPFSWGNAIVFFHERIS